MSVYATFGLGRKAPGSDAYSRITSTGNFLTKVGMGIRNPAAYSINGGGRDGYIAVDNGGFSAAHAPAFIPETGVFGSRKYLRDQSPMIEAKHANYTSNGSGRDGYIR